jgi:16S rRNA (guanine527-N7)-methyltransferase
MLSEWQSRMNLVARSTLDHLWQRHFADSAQLVKLGPMAPARWIDLGSGAGFPGVVVALLAEHHVTLVESTGKKCRFLEAVVEELGITNVTVCNSRIEAVSHGGFDVISARACAPLAKLFELGSPLTQPDTCWLLLKGEMVATEVEAARQSFNFSARMEPSRTDPRGRIIVANRVRRRIAG